MAIDFTQEKLIGLNQVADLPLMKTRGKRLSSATLNRWKKDGLQGVRLETVRVGGRRMTSVEAVERFIQRTQGDESALEGASLRTPTQRRMAVEQAKQYLFDEGVLKTEDMSPTSPPCLADSLPPLASRARRQRSAAGDGLVRRIKLTAQAIARSLLFAPDPT